MIAPARRTCRICAVEKPLNAFVKHAGCKYGRQYICGVCKGGYLRAWKARDPVGYKAKRAEYYRNHKAKHPDWNRSKHLRSTFGLSLEAYDAMLAAQGGGCAICGQTEPVAQKSNLCVDHDHKTGAVRGILCAGCNTGLGRFKDNLGLLVTAAAYLGAPRIPASVGVTSMLMFC